MTSRSRQRRHTHKAPQHSAAAQAKRAARNAAATNDAGQNGQARRDDATPAGAKPASPDLRAAVKGASAAGGADASPVKSVSTVFGEITWLMSQSPVYKQFTVGDLEWLVMPPILLKQFRMFYHEDKPVGVVLYAFLSEEVEKRIEAGAPTMRMSDWTSGDRAWIIEAIAPFGGADEMVKDCGGSVLEGRTVRMRGVGTKPPSTD
jgi:cytolysin-activating lysine-acyltransferase